MYEHKIKPSRDVIPGTNTEINYNTYCFEIK